MATLQKLKYSDRVAYRLPILLACAAVIEVLGFQYMLWSQDALNHHLSGLAFVWGAYLLTCYLLFKDQRSLDRHSVSKFIWILAIVVAIIVRIQMVLAEPYLADDYQRYLFDGTLLLAGLNPYAVVPLEFPELGGTEIPKPEIITIYPPLAEGLFVLAASLGGTLLTWRIMNLIPDLVGLFVFRQVLNQSGKPTAWLILWLWNPLILKEGLHSAHLEIWVLFVSVLFVYFAFRRRTVFAALALDIAILIKLIPLLLLPAWLTQITSEREKCMALVVTLCATIAGFAFFLPFHPFGSIIVFLQQVDGYGALYLVLSSLLGLWDVNPEWAKGLLMSFAAAIYIRLIFTERRFEGRSPISFLKIFVLFFVFSSMGFPWYLMPALPWLLITGNWLWILFLALTHIHYYAWQLDRPILALPFLILLTLLEIHKSGFHPKEVES